MFQMAVFCFAQRKHGAGQKPKFTGEERVREALGVSLCSQEFPALHLCIWLHAGFTVGCRPYPGRGPPSCSTRASLPQAPGILLPRHWIEPVPPALRGRFLTPRPPGKFLPAFSIFQVSFKGTEVATLGGETRF